MKTTLEQLRDVLAGTADETAVEAIRDGLCDLGSSVRLFFDMGKVVALRPFALNWTDIAAMLTDLEDQTAGHAFDEDLEEAGPLGDDNTDPVDSAVPGPSVSGWSKSGLERLRDRLAGRESADEPTASYCLVMFELDRPAAARTFANHFRELGCACRLVSQRRSFVDYDDLSTKIRYRCEFSLRMPQRAEDAIVARLQAFLSGYEFSGSQLSPRLSAGVLGGPAATSAT